MRILLLLMFALPICGASQAIILERVDAPSDLNFRVALWADVPAVRQVFYADPAKTSAFKNASQAEIDALRNGSVVERVQTFHFVAGTPIATIQARIRAVLDSFQNEVTNVNPWIRYGTRWNGLSWVISGVN